VTLKEKLIKKELTIGSWLSFGFTPVTEMMLKAGFDWLVIDLEHTSISIDQAFGMIQLIEQSGSVSLARVGKNDEYLIKRVMDAGAHGVVVPMINNAAEARQAVASVKYPPKGKRGVGLFRAQNYGAGFDEYKKWNEEQSIVIVQIEHYKGVENLESILEVEGVDGFIIGPYDLSGSMGMPGDFESQKMIDALQFVEKVMNNSEKVGGYHVVHSNHKLLENKINTGYKFIAYGDDMVFLSEKLREENDFLNDVKLRIKK